MRLFLIRHGQTEWNNGSRAQGHTDIALDETGLRQSQLAGEALRNEGIEAVISSDLRRSRQTADPIAKAAGVGLTLDPRLRERTFGDWEGDMYAEVGERMQALGKEGGLSLFDVRPPNGESVRDVWDRVGPAAAEIKAGNKTTAVVSHGGAGALLLAQIVGGTIEVSRAFRFANAGITELSQRSDGTFYIVRYNDTAHLKAETVLSGDLDGTHR
jgi:broad specificity phosphatase PhoE